MDANGRIDALCQRTVAEAFAAHPDLARSAGDHRYDGVLADSGEAAIRRRIAALEALAAELATVDSTGVPPPLRWDLGVARAAVRREHFHLTRLRDPWRDPRWAVSSADVSVYVLRPYAPLSERAEALCRHLEALPEHLAAALDLLEDELPGGATRVAIEEVVGHATFYREEVRPAFAAVDRSLAERLDRAIEQASAACARAADALRARRARDDLVLGEDLLCAMLESHEGVLETADSLRRRLASELELLGAEAEETAAHCGYPGDLGAAIAAMEADHPSADDLVAAARSTLDRLRRFWAQLEVVALPEGATCIVRPSPAFLSWVTAAYDSPGPLDPPTIPHLYYVTTIDPRWTDDQVEQWLRHLNHASLENISVHEVYPGHFVHTLHAHRQSSLTRKVFWFTGIGEGWAHYTELLAIEHGLAERRPFLHLAQIQDALLRACRFAASLAIHVDRVPVAEASGLFVEHARLPALAAQREAERATYDPLYLLYAYGKMEILRWRDLLCRRGGLSEREFHDRVLEVGWAPLTVVEEAVSDSR